MSRLLPLVILAVLPILISEPSSANIALTEVSATVFSTLKTEPQSLAASDVNDDGITELIIGYSTSDEGTGPGSVLAVYDGDADSIYPNMPKARARRAAAARARARSRSARSRPSRR